MKDVAALVLAAGKGTRMYSDLAKVLQPICDRPMLSYVLAALDELELARVLVVVGHQAERVQDVFATAAVEWVVQADQLGTAHAVQCALPQLADFGGHILFCCGDTPLLSVSTLRMVVEKHLNANAELTVLSMVLEDPGAYGRIVRDSHGKVAGIIEAKDASEHERNIREVNSGIYCASMELLHGLIPEIGNANVQGEYYLTDLVRKAVKRDWRVQAIAAADSRELFGVNTREELEAAARVIVQRDHQQTDDKTNSGAK